MLGALLVLGREPGGRSNRDEVIVVYAAYVVRMQRDEGLCASRRGDEFDRKGIRSVYLDDSTEVAPPQPVVGQVVFQYRPNRATLESFRPPGIRRHEPR